MRPASDLSRINRARASSGDNGEEDPPVPISNTEVKLSSADDTWREAAWESRSLPDLKYSSIAQLVEHAAVNRRVVGSSPTWGAMKRLAAT